MTGREYLYPKSVHVTQNPCRASANLPDGFRVGARISGKDTPGHRNSGRLIIGRNLCTQNPCIPKSVHFVVGSEVTYFSTFFDHSENISSFTGNAIQVEPFCTPKVQGFVALPRKFQPERISFEWELHFAECASTQLFLISAKNIQTAISKYV